MMTSRAPFFNDEEYRGYLRTLVPSRPRIVYATEFNSPGTHVTAGNSAGHISVFDVQSLAGNCNSFPSLGGPSAGVRSKRGDTLRQVEVGQGAVYGLHIHGDLLFCGTEKGIVGYKWKDLVSGGAAHCSQACSTTVQRAEGGRTEESVEVNALTGSQGDHLFAATGLGTVECYTADGLRLEGSYQGSGPGAYLHCITMRGSQEANSFVTGGDDGVVRCFDRRAGRTPQRQFRLRDLTSSKQDAWVGCISSDPDGNFIVCGDGNRNLTSIHVASGSVLGTAKLDFVPNASLYLNGDIYCGGADQHKLQPTQEDGESGKLLRFGVDCKQIGVADVSAGGVYALGAHSLSGCMTAAGYSTRGRWQDADELVDVYVNPPARSFSMRAPDIRCEG